VRVEGLKFEGLRRFNTVGLIPHGRKQNYDAVCGPFFLDVGGLRRLNRDNLSYFVIFVIDTPLWPPYSGARWLCCSPLLLPWRSPHDARAKHLEAFHLPSCIIPLPYKTTTGAPYCRSTMLRKNSTSAPTLG
jgi:hypothetical protein